jgi:hypothetical protein
VPPAIDPFATHPRAKDDQNNRFSSINNTKSTSRIKKQTEKTKTKKSQFSLINKQVTS